MVAAHGVRELCLQKLAPAVHLQRRGRVQAEALEQIELGPRQCARLAVDDAQRAEAVAIGAEQRDPRVEADMRLAADERVVAEPQIVARIADDQRLVLADRVVAERDVARGLARREPVLGLEPLPISVDEADERDRCAQRARRERREAVEQAVGRCVEDPIAVERAHPRRVVDHALPASRPSSSAWPAGGLRAKSAGRRSRVVARARDADRRHYKPQRGGGQARSGDGVARSGWPSPRGARECRGADTGGRYAVAMPGLPPVPAASNAWRTSAGRSSTLPSR
jgi:hypothetical protein